MKSSPQIAILKLVRRSGLGLLAVIALGLIGCNREESPLQIVGLWETQSPPGQGISAVVLFEEDGSVTFSLTQGAEPAEEYRGKYKLLKDGLVLDVPGMRGRAWPIHMHETTIRMQTPLGEAVLRR